MPDVPGHDMGVNLGGLHIRVAEEFLEHTDVHPVFQHVGGKAVPQGVAAGLFVDPGLLCGPIYRLLQPGFEHMMTQLPARARVKGAIPCRKYPLPAGLPHSLGVFPGQGLRDVNLSEPFLKILMMESLHRFDLRLQLVLQVPGQDGGSVLAALATPDKDEALAEIYILDAQADTLKQTQTAAIEQLRHEGVLACHGSEQPLNLHLGKHCGRPLLAFTTDRGNFSDQRLINDIPIEKNQGV